LSEINDSRTEILACEQRVRENFPEMRGDQLKLRTLCEFITGRVERGQVDGLYIVIGYQQESTAATVGRIDVGAEISITAARLGDICAVLLPALPYNEAKQAAHHLHKARGYLDRLVRRIGRVVVACESGLMKSTEPQN
jgi:ribosomal protein L36